MLKDFDRSFSDFDRSFSDFNSLKKQKKHVF